MDVCFWFAISREQSENEQHPLRFGIFGGFSAKERNEFVERYSVTADIARSEYYAADLDLWKWMNG
jgi:hypothetical protein